jgi:hypothetical protein
MEPLSRQQQRRLLRRFGELAVASIINRCPRHIRREAGRIYGAAAYRQMHELTGNGWRYAKRTPHPGIVEFVVNQAAQYQAYEPPSPPPAELDGDYSKV